MRIRAPEFRLPLSNGKLYFFLVPRLYDEEKISFFTLLRSFKFTVFPFLFINKYIYLKIIWFHQLK